MTRFSNPFNKAKDFWKLKPRAITYFITEIPEGSNSLLHAILAKRYKLYALNNLQKEKQESGQIINVLCMYTNKICFWSVNEMFQIQEKSFHCYLLAYLLTLLNSRNILYNDYKTAPERYSWLWSNRKEMQF